MESSFNYWKASTLGPHWDHFVLAKHVFKQSSGERHSAETEQHCETNLHSKAARETKSDYLKYCDNEHQGVKLMVPLGDYGHDRDAYSIQSSLPLCQAWEHRLPNCIEGSLSHFEKVPQHLMHPSPHMPSCTTSTVTNVQN
jgi:hypothetical protein